MNEYAVERMLINATRKRKGLCLKFVSPGFIGVPDRIVVLPRGRIGFAELKAPRKKPRRIQRVVLRQLYRLGCPVATIDNLKSAEGFIRRLLR